MSVIPCDPSRAAGAPAVHRTGPVIRKVLGLLVTAVLLGAVGCASTEGPSEKDKGLAQATRDVGIDHLNHGRTAMAIRKLLEADGIDPNDPVTHLSLGEAYRRKGMLDRAEQEILQAIALSDDPHSFNHQETVLNLSALYIQMKRYEEAIVQCDILIDDPTFSTPWRALTNRGWAELKLGRHAAARKSFEDALEFHPHYAPAHLNMGILDQRERRYAPALHHFERAVEDNRMPPDAIAEANYRMAEIYVATGKRGKAIEHFSVALERSPYGEWGTQSKSYLELLR
jgi:Tfp pilus assembly protein PilF